MWNNIKCTYYSQSKQQNIDIFTHIKMTTISFNIFDENVYIYNREV